MTTHTESVSASHPARRPAKNRKRSVFVSFCHPEEALYRNLMLAWDANDEVLFNFNLASPLQAIDSNNLRVIQTRLQNLLKGTDCMLVIVGPTTHSSDWVNWEVQAAQKLGIPVVAVKLARALRGPPSLYRAGTRFINKFDQAQIRKALRET